MHIVFDPDSVNWFDYFASQSGGGAVFEGVPYMRGVEYMPYRATGNGIGSIFAPLFRYLVPFIKTVGKELGREGLATGIRVADDIISGKKLKESVQNELKSGLGNLVDNVYAKTTTLNKPQSGSGKKRKTINKRAKKFPINHFTISGPAQLTKDIKKRRDYFGAY